MIENFWSHQSRLPSNTVDRLVTILEAMYSPASEHHYLAYATNLLLEMTSRSPDYKRHIFEHPLSECTFKVFILACFLLVVLLATPSYSYRHGCLYISMTNSTPTQF